ncbi:porin family protein [Apibacter muscae]|nr:porin family protein [Apibacter muscae]
MRRIKLFLPMLAMTFGLGNLAQAQIQKGNLMVGGTITDMDFGLKKGQSWGIGITPKLGYFIKDNLAVGGYVNVDISKQGQGSTTRTGYGVGAFGRYYANKEDINNLLKNGRFFFEVNAGLEGANQKGEPTTNGFGFGLGPGYSYFITPNIGLEALVKYNGLTGGGNEGYQHDLSFNVGFQIYLPTSKVKNRLNNL